MNVPSLFNNLPIKGYFGFTQFLAITNEIAMHSPMQIFVWKYAFISLRQISSNAIDNRYGTCMVNFLKTAKQSPRVAVTYYTPMYDICFSTYLPAFDVTTAF